MKTSFGTATDAAALVAADEQTNDEIAAQCGVTAPNLERWKRYPEFRRRVQERWDGNVAVPTRRNYSPCSGCAVGSVAALDVSSIHFHACHNEGEPSMISPEIRAQIRRYF
jgi:hypothetical protein